MSYIVLDGSEAKEINIDKPNTVRVSCYNLLKNKNGLSNNIDLKCTHLLGVRNWDTDVEGVYINNSDLIFRINKSVVGTTIEEVNAWLSANPVEVYYQLATPVEIDLGEYDIKSLKGVNHVTVEAELPATYMEETYINDITKELEQIKNALLSTGANV